MSDLINTPPPEPEPAATDANDYSRFDNLNMNDSTDSDDGGDEVPSTASQISPAESIAQANASKAEGNNAFKASQYVEAKLHYDTAIKVLVPHKKLQEPAVTSQERVEIQSLLVSLLGNSAMVLMKQEDWAGAVKCADNVLKTEPDNVKGLFRRGTCHSRLGNLEAGKEDLQRVVDLDPSNTAAKKELNELIKTLKLQKQKEKAAFAGAFSGSSMYADREKERAIKAKKLEDEKRREQDQWTQSKLTRRDAGLPEQTFEEWKKERDDKKKAADEAAKKSSPAKKTSSPAPAPKKPKIVAPDDEDEYDEEDAKLIKETTSKGYCYFRNQLDTETKELIGDIAPKSLDASPVAVAPVVTPAEATAPTVKSSDWNHAGTWEERDMSKMVKDRLTDLCWASTCEKPMTGGDDETATLRAIVKEVKKVDGDAQIVLTRGKRQHLYDYQLDVKFEVAFGKSKYSGHLEFADVSPGCSFECTIKYNKAIPSHLEAEAKSCVAGLRDEIVSKIRTFEAEYKTM